MLGDSTAVGLGDPVPGRGWRGVGPFVARALDIAPAGYLNTAFTGARMRCVRYDQLPVAIAHRPDVAVVIVGMNDTLRSDFDAAGMAADLDQVVTELTASGAVVVPVRFHDHGKVFRLPGPLYRALAARIDELNEAVDGIVHRHGVPCLDLAEMPGAYDLSSWSVDRLHPSELGHRMLARGFTDLLAATGITVAEPVSLVCSGGVSPSTLDHVGWLVVKGIPWLWRRGRDLLPYAAAIMAASAKQSYLNWRAGTEVAAPEPPPSALQIR
ncbi:SGNH/GDSL hydrolase family protein [Amycolatopsis alkalitolerans]|uniref:SGNH/GDSL hydrolase family protein n=1 Tax=Amycolatopsis alkalitolerans TaxID=2547244 RepID=A0A5C4M2D2_9PSEU|nr:SGNH/GDSL hydrolase family protein [Amycolatopsis alkalitolerans]